MMMMMMPATSSRSPCQHHHQQGPGALWRLYAQDGPSFSALSNVVTVARQSDGPPAAGAGSPTYHSTAGSQAGHLAGASYPGSGAGVPAAVATSASGSGMNWLAHMAPSGGGSAAADKGVALVRTESVTAMLLELGCGGAVVASPPGYSPLSSSNCPSMADAASLNTDVGGGVALLPAVASSAPVRHGVLHGPAAHTHSFTEGVTGWHRAGAGAVAGGEHAAATQQAMRSAASVSQLLGGALSAPAPRQPASLQAQSQSQLQPLRGTRPRVSRVLSFVQSASQHSTRSGTVGESTRNSDYFGRPQQAATASGASLTLAQLSSGHLAQRQQAQPQTASFGGAVRGVDGTPTATAAAAAGGAEHAWHEVTVVPIRDAQLEKEVLLVVQVGAGLGGALDHSYAGGHWLRGGVAAGAAGLPCTASVGVQAHVYKPVVPDLRRHFGCPGLMSTSPHWPWW